MCGIALNTCSLSPLVKVLSPWQCLAQFRAGQIAASKARDVHARFHANAEILLCGLSNKAFGRSDIPQHAQLACVTGWRLPNFSRLQAKLSQAAVKAMQ